MAACAYPRCPSCPCPPQPRYQEVVDAMVGQLLRLLWEQERAGRGRYRCAPARAAAAPWAPTQPAAAAARVPCTRTSGWRLLGPSTLAIHL